MNWANVLSVKKAATKYQVDVKKIESSSSADVVEIFKSRNWGCCFVVEGGREAVGDSQGREGEGARGAATSWKFGKLKNTFLFSSKLFLPSQQMLGLKQWEKLRKAFVDGAEVG